MIDTMPRPFRTHTRSLGDPRFAVRLRCPSYRANGHLRAASALRIAAAPGVLARVLPAVRALARQRNRRALHGAALRQEAAALGRAVEAWASDRGHAVVVFLPTA